MNSDDRVALYILETDASVSLGPPLLRPNKPRTARAGGGIVLRDPDLVVLAARSVPLGPIESPTLAELAALVAGLKVALEFRVRTLRAWSDNLSLVRLLNREGGFEVQGSEVLLGRLAELRMRFDRLEFRWAPGSHAPERRAGEYTADCLARRAVGLPDRPIRPRG